MYVVDIFAMFMCNGATEGFLVSAVFLAEVLYIYLLLCLVDDLYLAYICHEHSTDNFIKEQLAALKTKIRQVRPSGNSRHCVILI